MKGFLTTHKGMEETAAAEVQELIVSNSIIDDACIVFSIKSYEDLFKLCYRSQSSKGVYLFLAGFNYENIFKDFSRNIENISFIGWINKGIKFRVKCAKYNKSIISTPELERKLGEIIIDHIQKKHNYRLNVGLDEPEIIFFFYLTKTKCYVGVDFVGFDLCKRSYKQLQHAADIKGTIAYSLIRLASYEKNETLLDTFSGSGTIPIEAALFASKFSVRFFDKEKFIFLKFQKFKSLDFSGLFKKFDKEATGNKLKIYNIDASMKHINYAKKNSKLSGTEKKIKFSRMETEWLDTKFDKNSISKIVTKIPILRKAGDQLYNEFFYQAEFILKDKGKLVLIGDEKLIKKYASKYNFKLVLKKEIFSGNMKYDVLIMAK